MCSGCHRAVHLGLLRISALGGQRFEFRDKHGDLMDAAPPLFGTADLILANQAIEPTTVAGHWSGEALDLPLATSMILDYWLTKGHRPWWERAGLSGPPDDPDPAAQTA